MSITELRSATGGQAVSPARPGLPGWVAAALLAGGALAGAVVAAGAGSSLVLLTLAAVFVLVLARHQAALPHVWVLGTVLLPYWLALFVNRLIVPVATVLALLVFAAAAISPSTWRLSPAPGFRTVFTWADILIALYLLASVIGAVLGGSDALSRTLIVHWLPPFFLARVLFGGPRNRVAHGLTLTLVAVAALAVVEFVANWHPMLEVPALSPSLDSWRKLQLRGGLPRSEWSFGHSIALGGSLALGIPLLSSLAISSRLRALGTAVLLLGILSTGSRGALVCGGVGLVLSLIASARWRVLGAKGGGAAAVAAVLVLLAALPVLVPASERASDELEATAEHRRTLVEELAGTTQPLGLSTAKQAYSDYRYKFGKHTTTDNALLTIALHTGWIPALLLGALLLTHLARAALGRAGPWETAAAAQLPLLLTVALITQHQALFWFVEGMAVAEISRIRHEPGGSTGPNPVPEQIGASPE